MTSRHRLLFDSYITPPPDNGNKTSVGYRVDPNFDGNMVIVLVALLSALICALGLNSIVRCVLRWTRPIGPESADRVSVRLAASSLKKEALNSIPVVAYKPGLRILATDCPICLGDFVEGEDVRVFPRCDHGFHVVCIDKWLALHSSCPTCRQPVIERSMGGGGGGGGAELVRVQID